MKAVWLIIAALWLLWFAIIAIGNLVARRWWKNHKVAYRRVMRVAHGSKRVWPIIAVLAFFLENIWEMWGFGYFGGGFRF